MKHIFMINPAAGNGRVEKELLPRILKGLKDSEVDYEIHRAMSPGTSAQHIQRRCMDGTPVRFYACGGDGTLNVVLNSIMGYENAEIACIPAGTGNDFVRSFQGQKHFSNISRQLQGKAVPLDVMGYNGRYALNTLNIGLDCEVVSQAASHRNQPFLGRKGAYAGGIAKVLFGGAHFPMELEFEGGEVLRRDFTLLAMANGRFCGGGFQSAPRAELDDGFFDVCIVKQLPRHRMLPLLMKYKAGAHLEDEECRKYLVYKQCRRMTATAAEGGGPLKIAADGEIQVCDSLTVELVPGAVRFSIPEGASI